MKRGEPVNKQSMRGFLAMVERDFPDEIVRIHEPVRRELDITSRAKADRPGLTQALSYVRSDDVLVVWKLDRLGRSMSHLITKISELEGRSVGLRSLTEQIDTTTPDGRLIFHVFGALGQFERDLIRERTRAGLKAAEARGRRGGRKPVSSQRRNCNARVN